MIAEVKSVFAAESAAVPLVAPCTRDMVRTSLVSERSLANSADGQATSDAVFAAVEGFGGWAGKAERLPAFAILCRSPQHQRDTDRAAHHLVALVETDVLSVAHAARRFVHERLSYARLEPLMAETDSADPTELSAAIERSRAARALRAAVGEAETAIKSGGDGKSLEELLQALDGVDPDGLAGRTQTLAAELNALNNAVAAAATSHSDARTAFAGLESLVDPAVDAATDAELARAELGVLSEQYILKRAQAVTLRWATEQYRGRHQDPLLLRASERFSTLTIGRYVALRIDNDGATPRLLGLRDHGRTVVEVGAMSEGTTDQLFLALRLAAVEQSVAAGVRLPFLADDLFVDFDNERSEADFRVMAELAKSTQVLFFTHHPHLAAIARTVVGADIHSECSL